MDARHHLIHATIRVRDARPGGPGHRRARAKATGSLRSPARRGPGAVGHSRIVPYGARSPVRRLSAEHAQRMALEDKKAREPMPVRGPSKLLRAKERQAVKELPQPQPPVAFGLLKVKPLPWKVDT